MHLEELDLTEPTNKETTSSVISYANQLIDIRGAWASNIYDQLQCKAKSLQQLVTKILSSKIPKDLEREVFDAIEIQDMLIEKWHAAVSVLSFSCSCELSWQFGPSKKCF